MGVEVRGRGIAWEGGGTGEGLRGGETRVWVRRTGLGTYVMPVGVRGGGGGSGGREGDRGEENWEGVGREREFYEG